MNKSNQRISKFNPGTLQSDEDVKEQFVVRERELEIVLEVLRGNIDSPSCQHVLVVAHRGQGKTMLLARVAAEVNTNDKLSECLLPIRFMEESYEIFNLTDFWLDTLLHLARESVKYDSELARELQETHADLAPRWQEKNLSDLVRTAVLEAADRLGKKLVLMVENLEALYRNVDKDFGWKLRGVLQSEPQIMLLATATSRFEELDDAEQPFFELFRIVALEALPTKECQLLWNAVSGDSVSEQAVRPLEILTGGNSRLLVIIACFARHRSLRQLLEELVALIDEHTEYFRSHLEGLAKNERRVYISVIDLWKPSSAAEIATRARMDVRPVSAFLRRLAERGAVIVEEKGKKQRYVVAERLYSIYYKLRRERDEASVVKNLIHFMTVFYSDAELAEMSGRLNEEATRSPMIREGIKRAVAEQPQSSHFITDNKNVQQLLNKAFTHWQRGELEAEIETYDEVVTRFGASDEADLQEKVAWALSFKADAHKKRGELEAAIEAYDEVVTRFGASDEADLQEKVASALSDKAKEHEERGELKEAIEAYDDVITRFGASDNASLQTQVASALSLKGGAYEERGELEAAIEAYDEAITHYGSSDASRFGVASTLTHKGEAHEKCGEFKEAIEAYDAAVEAYDDELRLEVASTLTHKGEAHEKCGEFKAYLRLEIAWTLLDKAEAHRNLGELKEAIEAYDEVITRFGSSKEVCLQIRVASALSDKGMRQIDMGLAEEALNTCRELELRLGTLTENERNEYTWRAMYMRALALLAQGRHQAAMDAFRFAYVVFAPSNEVMMYDMQRIVPKLIVAGASARDLVEILSSDKAKSSTLAPLIVALRQRTGEKVRAPVEVLEVADDIKKRIEDIRNFIKARVAKGTHGTS